MGVGGADDTIVGEAVGVSCDGVLAGATVNCRRGR